MGINIRIIPVVILCFLLNACGGRVYAPVVTPGEASAPPHASAQARATGPDGTTIVPAQHEVARGDTLYSIAFNYGFDYRDVAAWNNIRAPYTIYPGQRLSLRAPAPAVASRNQPGPSTEAQPLTQGPIVTKKSGTKVPPPADLKPGAPAVTPATRNTGTLPKPAPDKNAPLPAGGVIKWAWPTPGKVITSSTPISKNGIDIAGIQGQSINAAAAGDIVYSGSGLLGYGRLIIIKHNDHFLSAYAHNDQLLVKEGERVTAGHNIARMGQTTNGRTLLHFEIRKNGQPVDPLTYLPKQ